MTLSVESVLPEIASLTSTLTVTKVHPALFPYPLLTSLHAARVSIAYQSQVWATGHKGRLTWGTYLAGFLVMAWGGSLLTHLLLSAPPPPIYSISPWIIYISIHVFLTSVFHFIPFLLNPRIVDTVSPFFDAIVRTLTITHCLKLLSSHPHPDVSHSLIMHLLVGAVSISGGGQLAATLGTWNAEWRLSTPAFLNGGLIRTLDVWSGSLAAFVYILLTSSSDSLHPSYRYIRSLPVLINKGEIPLMSQADAKAVVTLLLTVLYAWRVAVVHWGLRWAFTKTKTRKKTKTQ